MQCFQELGHSSEEMMPVELRDDGLYAVTCQNGHSTVTAIQQQKFEVLFDLAAMALLDGYPREASTSMAAALERFYEFYVRVICIKHKVDKDVFMSTWKGIENRSERQFGAYLFVALLDKPKSIPATIENAMPTLPSTSKGQSLSWSGFRNAVVHKGYIPSTVESFAYGELVFRHINQLINELKKTHSQHLQEATVAHLLRAHNGSAGKQVSTMSIPTLLSLVHERPPDASFQDAIKELEKYRKWLHRK